ncbi:MAG: branched-chain amino acid ABC transporter permease [Rhodospirillales bacterium]|nr:branched-chain amino acid ABC transporter permease [Rhodospirillales bacterium]
MSTALLLSALVGGLANGAVYALVALGLTLIYGVLHIINFAHGSLLMLALYASWILWSALGVSPYVALVLLAPLFFALGYALQRWVIGPAGQGRDANVLLVTLGVSIVIDNLALAVFGPATRTVDIPLATSTIDLGVMYLPLPRLIAFVAALLLSGGLWLLLNRTDLGRAIRAVARESDAARLVGIRVAHIHAVTFGIGTASVAAAACLLLPSFYVSPDAGYAFVLVAFTVVVMGGMGSFPGALLAGLVIGVIESFSGLWFGPSLAPIGIYAAFALVLLFRPTGLFGARA